MSFSLRAKRVLAGAATGALALSMMPAGVAAADEHLDVCAGAPESDFTDRGDTHGANIDCLFGYGITTGQTATTFGTFNDMTRGQAATFFVNFASVATDGDIADEIDEDIDVPFEDIAGTTHEGNIEAIYRLDLISGTTATTYSPNEPMTREQFATVLFNAHEALGVEFDDEYDDAFTDTANSVHEDQINALAGEGIISGTTATTYSPQANVVRGQLATLFMESAQVLDNAGLWTDDRPWAPTNQTFAVSPDDSEVMPRTDGDADDAGSRDFSVDASAAASVSIALVDADDVTVDNGIVTFDEDADEVDFLGDDDAEITGVSTDGTLVPGTAAKFDGVAGGEIEFTVQASSTGADPVNFHPVVFVGDDDDELPLDDGEPENDFGIGGATWFADVNELQSDPAAGATTEEREGTTVEVEVSLTNTDTAEDFTVPVEGQTVEYRVVEDGAALVYGNIASDDIVQSGEADTDEGVVTFEIDGSEAEEGDPDWDVYVRWQGSGAYAGAEQTLDGGNEVRIEWVDAEPAAAGLEFDADESFNEVGTTHTVSVQVVDQFDEPYALDAEDDWQVDFTVDTDTGGDFTNSVAVASDGTASFSYTGPAESGTDAIGADLVEADDPTTTVDDPGGAAITASAEKHWWVDAEEGDDVEGANDAEVIGANFDTEHVIVKVGDGNDGNDDLDTNAVLRFDYDASDFYVTDDGPATKAQWVERLEDILDPEVTVDEDSLITENYLDDENNTTFELAEII